MDGVEVVDQDAVVRAQPDQDRGKANTDHVQLAKQHARRDRPGQQRQHQHERHPQQRALRTIKQPQHQRRQHRRQQHHDRDVRLHVAGVLRDKGRLARDRDCVAHVRRLHARRRLDGPAHRGDKVLALVERPQRLPRPDLDDDDSRWLGRRNIRQRQRCRGLRLQPREKLQGIDAPQEHLARVHHPAQLAPRIRQACRQFIGGEQRLKLRELLRRQVRDHPTGELHHRLEPALTDHAHRLHFGKMVERPGQLLGDLGDRRRSSQDNRDVLRRTDDRE